MRRFLLAAAFCLMVACAAPEQGAEEDQSTEASNAVGTTTVDPTQPSTISEVEEADMDLVEPALLDLARRLKVPADQIKALEVEKVTWPDGSLGCPQPDQMYTQALVEGHRIVLGHGERIFLYHSSGDVPPFLCESDEIDGGYDFIPPPGSGEK